MRKNSIDEKSWERSERNPKTPLLEFFLFVLSGTNNSGAEINRRRPARHTQVARLFLYIKKRQTEKEKKNIYIKMEFKMTRRDPRDEKRKKEKETNFSVENENTSLSLSPSSRSATLTYSSPRLNDLLLAIRTSSYISTTCPRYSRLNLCRVASSHRLLFSRCFDYISPRFVVCCGRQTHAHKLSLPENETIKKEKEKRKHFYLLVEARLLKKKHKRNIRL